MPKSSKAFAMPGPSRRTTGAKALAYRLAQVLVTLDQLTVPGLPQHLKNACIESALIDLRALVGFLLMDTDIAMMRKATDVKPSWYMPAGIKWVPRTWRRQTALRAFYEAVGAHLAHAAMTSQAHPGDWPLVEAAIVVAQDLGRLVDQLDALAPAEAKRFERGKSPLRATLASFASRSYAIQQKARRSERSVSRARRLLRSQLGLPHR